MMKYISTALIALSLTILTACASASVDSIVGVTDALVATAQSSEQNSDDAGATSATTAVPTAPPTATPTETPTATLTPTSTPTATATPIPPTATATPVTSPCGSIGYQTRLSIGQRAHVLPVPPVANTVRSSPDKSTRKVGDILPNGAMTILDGPKCANSWFWWYVQADNGVTGWTPEGERGEYWLAPGEPTAEPPVASPPTNCGNATVPRLIVGGQALMVDSEPNNLRTQPATSARKVDEISRGAVVDVLDGPVCDQAKGQFQYWLVQTDRGVTGWTPEGKNGVYWLEPIDGTSVSPPSGAAYDVNLRPKCGTEQRVSSADQITFNAFWGAKGEDLARMSSDVVEIVIWLDGQPLNSARAPVLLSEFEIPCVAGPRDSYWLVESAAVGQLSPGRHQVTVQYNFGEQLTDGFDDNGDGRPDSYGPGGDYGNFSRDYILTVR